MYNRLHNNRRVLFIDESRFILHGNDCRIRVWRQREGMIRRHMASIRTFRDGSDLEIFFPSHRTYDYTTIRV